MSNSPSLRMRAWILSFTMSARRPEAESATLQRSVLYVVYGKDIMARLARIHAHAGRDGPDGTLAVVLHSRTPGHVRCAFTHGGKMLLCEAAAGADPSTRTFVSATTKAALREAGYWRDQTTGRFLFPYEIGEEPNESVWGGVSVTILAPLIDVFGARPGSDIEIVAPLAPEP